jgi:Iron-containing redox enzyme
MQLLYPMTRQKASQTFMDDQSFAPHRDRNTLLDDPSALHSTLAEFNHQRLHPNKLSMDWESDIWDAVPTQIAEGKFLEQERAKIRCLSAQAPTDSEGFIAWFEAQKRVGPGQFDPFFDWLAQAANYEQMRWFIQQEFAGEAGFDDLVALTQLKLPVQAKLELARNYWDEMGRGKANSMHGPLLDCLAAEMDVTHTPESDLAWEALALSNLLVGLAANRRYAYHSLGALGAIELTSPSRAVKVADGLERLGLSRSATYYYRLHATVDITHAEDWKREVLKPIIAESPDVAVLIAEGALMRLNAGARCFDRYRAQFGLDHPMAYVA